MPNPKQLLPLLVFDFFLAVFLTWGNWRINQTLQPQQTSSVLVRATRGENPENPAPENSKNEVSSVTLEKIFDDNDEAGNYSPEKIRTLVATGDVMLGRAVNARSVKEKKFQWPFEKTADFLKSADLTLVNLESPFLSPCFPTTEGMKFCSDPAHVDGLKLAGVDVVNLANNHFYDQGEAGAKTTREVLKINSLLASGWGETAFQNVRGLTFGFLGYCPVCGGQESLEGAGQERLVLEIEAARKSADLLIVSFHWGEEYQSEPGPVQRELGRLAIDSGADLVIGHHPHWVQPVEIYQDKLIVYSLGNFIFDQMWSEETKTGLVAYFVFLDKKLVDVHFKPVKIEALGQPEWQGGQSARTLEELKRRSFFLNP